MPKEKITHLFNKNHIEVVKIEHPYPHNQVGEGRATSEIFTTSSGIRAPWHQPKAREVTERKVSPLGFYYTKKKIIQDAPQLTDHRTWEVLSYQVNGVVYQLKYMLRYDDNSITSSEEGLRPWEICPGDGDFSDNMLNALVKECNKFFMRLYDNKISKIYDIQLGSSNKGYGRGVGVVKKDTYRALFGNAEGPRFQTDMEKVISHGFDPKVSFRKRKEEK